MKGVQTMPEIPEGAAVPQDRKLSRVEQFESGLAEIRLSKEVLPLGLRPRQRNEVMGLALDLRGLVVAEEGAETVELDTDAMSDEQMKGLLDIIASFDEIMADQALDKDAYDMWSRLAGYEDFTSLLTLYGGLLGESTSSTS